MEGRTARAGRTSVLVLTVVAAAASLLVLAPAPPAAAQVEVVTDIFVFRSDGPLTSDPCPGVAPRNQYEWDENNLNGGSIFGTRRHLYFCIRKDPLDATGLPLAPVTDITFVTPDDRTFFPACPTDTAGAATQPVSSVIGAQDLNEGVGGEFIYACLWRDPARGGPLLDVDVVFAGDLGCPSGYRSTGQNLNEGNIEGALFVTACVSPFTPSNYTYACGNEGEAPCDVAEFLIANGTVFGCDRGLFPENGTCAASTRDGPRAREFAGTWAHWALLNQTNDLAFDVPLSRYTQVGAHNGYNSFADGWVVPNQSISITDQLRAGVRVLDLDVYDSINANPLPKLCHVVCSLTERLFDSAIKEIRNWMLEPGNLDQTIVILLEDDVDSTIGQLGILASLQEHFVDTGIGVVRGDQLEVSLTPTREEMLDAGTRVAVYAQQRDYGDLVHRKQGDNFFFGTLGGIRFDDTKDTCATDGITAPVLGTGFANISEVNGDRVDPGPQFNIDADDLETLVACGINIINLDFVLGVVFEPDRLEAAVWSWEEGDRGDNGDAAMFVGLTGRWRSRPHTEVHRFACQLRNELRITRSAGPWQQGWVTCREEFPGSSFMVPVNGWENDQLFDANGARTDLWLNYNDIAEPDRWVRTRDPGVAIRPLATPVLVERALPYTFRWSATSDVAAAAWDCGSGLQAGGEYQARGGQFFCQFDSGGSAQSLETVQEVTLRTINREGIPADATTTVRIQNATPTIDPDLVTVDPNPVIEGSPTRIVVPFDDPGVGDRHTAFVEWSDGVTQGLTIPAFTQELVVERVFDDDDPTGTSVDRHSALILLSDERSSVQTRVEVDVANFAPQVTGVRTPGLAGRGDEVEVEVTFQDVASDDHVVTIDWGDGSPTSDGPTASHVYETVGRFQITASVVDDDGGTGFGISSITIEETDPVRRFEALADALRALDDGQWEVRVALRSLEGDPAREVVGALPALRDGRYNLAMFHLWSARHAVLALAERTGDQAAVAALADIDRGMDLVRQERLEAWPRWWVAASAGAPTG